MKEGILSKIRTYRDDVEEVLDSDLSALRDGEDSDTGGLGVDLGHPVCDGIVGGRPREVDKPVHLVRLVVKQRHGLCGGSAHEEDISDEKR